MRRPETVLLTEVYLHVMGNGHVAPHRHLRRTRSSDNSAAIFSLSPRIHFASSSILTSPGVFTDSPTVPKGKELGPGTAHLSEKAWGCEAVWLVQLRSVLFCAPPWLPSRSPSLLSRFAGQPPSPSPQSAPMFLGFAHRTREAPARHVGCYGRLKRYAPYGK
jgi:hypothetical protein